MQTAPRVWRPNRKEVNLYYTTHRSEFYEAERVRVAQVVKNVSEFEDEAPALAILEQAAAEVNAGASFGIVAERFSDCPANGGELDWFARGVMVEEFEEVAFALSPGETSTIFRSPFGFHFIRLLEKREAGIRPLSEIYEQLSNWMYQQRLAKQA